MTFHTSGRALEMHREAEEWSPLAGIWEIQQAIKATVGQRKGETMSPRKPFFVFSPSTISGWSLSSAGLKR